MVMSSDGSSGPDALHEGGSKRKKGRSKKKRRRGPKKREAATRVTFPLPSKVVIVGDLNGDDDALSAILRGCGVTDADGRWVADDTHLVQLGDVVNRGVGCRAALERLMRLTEEAKARSSRVTVLLGNHEAMVTLKNQAWCHPEEFLEFATAEERQRFEMARTRRVYELLELRSHGGRTDPITGALRAWEESNVPGRVAYEHAFSAAGPYGQYIRNLPVAIRIGPLLLVHGGLMPRFCQNGLATLDDDVREIWAKAPETALDLSPDSALAAEDGPLWCRVFAAGDDAEVGSIIDATLASTRTELMVIGHTRTDLIGGERGYPLLRLGGRLLCADVGIGSSGGAPAAITVEKDVVWCWRPDDKRRRLRGLG